MCKEERAISYWTMGQRFLKMANVTSQQLTESGNPWVVTSDKEISSEEYEQETKWADHNIGIPILFNFYHGIELMLKGFLLFFEDEGNLRTHKFTNLISRLKLYLPPDDHFIEKVEIYTNNSNSIIKTFLSENNISIDGWYESLKYPERSVNEEFTHLPLIYNSGRVLDFWRILANDSLEIIKLARTYHLEHRDEYNQSQS